MHIVQLLTLYCMSYTCSTALAHPYSNYSMNIFHFATPWSLEKMHITVVYMKYLDRSTHSALGSMRIIECLGRSKINTDMHNLDIMRLNYICYAYIDYVWFCTSDFFVNIVGLCAPICVCLFLHVQNHGVVYLGLIADTRNKAEKQAIESGRRGENSSD